MTAEDSARPPVTVVVPFLGDAGEALDLLARLDRIDRRREDQLIIVDNSPAPMVVAEGGGGIEVIREARVQSSYLARNAGARVAGNEWLLFLDADVRPVPDILDRYFEPPIPDATAMVAGEVGSAPEQDELAARHMRARGHLSIESLQRGRPYAVAATANLLVQRALWERLGGFSEVRSGADFDFCIRAQGIGCALTYRPEARVEHFHDETVRGMLRKANRYGPGQRWLNDRFPGAAPRPGLLRQLLRSVAGFLIWTVRGERERAAFKALDGLWMAAYSAGYYFGDNRPRQSPAAGADGQVRP